jgi:mRNA interferase HigB
MNTICIHVNIIKPLRIHEYAKTHARAETSSLLWLAKAKYARWTNLADVRATFGSADQVPVASGKNVIVFNIGGNNYRLICAAHFNRGNLYILKFLTHAEYSKGTWKHEL